MTAIVVGVDDSPQSHRALEWALDEARVRDARVIAAHAWRAPMAAHSPAAAAMAAGTMLLDPPVDRALERALQRVDATGVDVEQRTVVGDAADVLIAIARDEPADLLVVGSRTHGGLVGLLRGSTATTLAHHAPCPLVIVPARDAG